MALWETFQFPLWRLWRVPGLFQPMVKPGRLGEAARKKAGLEWKAKSEDKDAQHALADEVLEEETPIKLWQKGGGT